MKYLAVCRLNRLGKFVKQPTAFPARAASKRAKQSAVNFLFPGGPQDGDGIS